MVEKIFDCISFVLFGRSFQNFIDYRGFYLRKEAKYVIIDCTNI